MPSSNLTNNDFLASMSNLSARDRLNLLYDYLYAIQTELNALSATTLREGAVRNVGTGSNNLVETSRLNTRLGTSGNLGGAALLTVAEQTVTINTNDFSSSSIKLFLYRIGKLVVISNPNSQTVNNVTNEFAESNAGAIPSGFRPVYDGTLDSFEQVTMVSDIASLRYQKVVIYSDGTFAVSNGRTDSTVQNDVTSVKNFTMAFMTP